MRMKSFEATRGLPWGVIGLLAIFSVLSVSTEAADAHSKRKPRQAPAAAANAYSPRYADIVVDVNSGSVLQSTAADSTRHPASLTKIMTLYMLFERLESGQMKLSSEMPVSSYAARQAPSKLGLKPGQTIQVEDAIKAIVTKSANDVAVVIAEAIGGDEANFAKLMTGKARALGMNRTVYRNASGLPDNAQITTARDQALLGRAVQERFPRYYKYFSTTRFAFQGKPITGHNRLIGKVTGVDGIKTGFINASGFNLVTSMRRGNRHLVAVVLGGQTARARDARMRQLLETYVQIASAKRTAPALAQAKKLTAPPSAAQRIAAAVISPVKADPAHTSTIPMPRPAPTAIPGSSHPLQPVLVKTVSVKPARMNTASLGRQPEMALAALPATAQPPAGPELSYAATPSATSRPGILGVLPIKIASASPAEPLASAAAAVADSTAEMPRSGWMIQVGAFDQETDAKRRLAAAQDRAKSLLGEADPFTERVTKGDKTLYRARFAGLDKSRAEAACNYLKKNDMACTALRN
jgi:D-alanyl-D-alanine carboxypeptidase